MAALRAAAMLTQEQAVEMWVWKKQGRSIRQIAREMGWRAHRAPVSA